MVLGDFWAHQNKIWFWKKNGDHDLMVNIFLGMKILDDAFLMSRINGMCF